MATTKQTLPRHEWVAEFSLEVERLRKVGTGKFVAALAHQQWVANADKDPVKVAQAWSKRAGHAN